MDSLLFLYQKVLETKMETENVHETWEESWGTASYESLTNCTLTTNDAGAVKVKLW